MKRLRLIYFILIRKPIVGLKLTCDCLIRHSLNRESGATESARPAEPGISVCDSPAPRTSFLIRVLVYIHKLMSVNNTAMLVVRDR